MSSKKGIWSYVVFDFLAAAAAWTLFFLYRKVYNELLPFDLGLLQNDRYFLGVVLLPLGWIMFYGLFDSYRDVYKMSRLEEFSRTFIMSLAGVLFIFFALVLDDFYISSPSFLRSLGVLFFLHFTLTVVPRLFILTAAHAEIQKGKAGFRTLLIGGNANAKLLYDEIRKSHVGLGFDFLGFLSVGALDQNTGLQGVIPCLGSIEELDRIVKQTDAEEVIIALDAHEHQHIGQILGVLYQFEGLTIRAIPDMYEILLGTVKMKNVFGAVLIEIKQGLMPLWQQILKRVIDVTASSLFLLLFSWLYAFCAYKVKRSSAGPIFYRQARVGLHGQEFQIIKFRSMRTDAEAAGPQLSKDSDPRITPWGHIMRKYRLDEIPQFWNVLLGEMSLVGPRPERQFFIDQIKEKAPHVTQLCKVRPGITSWGQVQYGYASNIDEMVARLKFDILYIENQSLALDFKILIYTVMVILGGKGK